MCDPVTMAVVSIGTTVASTGLGLMGQAQQAAAQRAMYGYQRQVAENNRLAAERMAVDAEERGRVREDRARLRSRSAMGTQITALAGQGTDLAGSPTDILGDAAAASDADALAIRSNAAREVWGYRSRGVEFGNEAALAQSRRAGSGLSALGVGASLIGDAGTVAEKWYRFGRGRTGG